MSTADKKSLVRHGGLVSFRILGSDAEAAVVSHSLRFQSPVHPTFPLLCALCVIPACAPFAPLPYTPPEPPALQGAFAPNEELRAAESLGVGALATSEDVAVDAQGRFYGSAEDGVIRRLTVHPDGHESVDVFAEISGRPLGLHFDAAGNLIAACASTGLLAADPSGLVSVLANETDGAPLRFTEDLDIAGDGRIYFSEASSKWGIEDTHLAILEGRADGRLLRFDPSTQETEVLLEGLYFANGVALSEREDFVLVCETARYRITRSWLSGPNAGAHDVFIDNLPGLPDGVSSNRRGTFWVALFTPRNALLDWLHPQPCLKDVFSVIPRDVWLALLEPYGFVLALDEQGNVVRTLQDSGGSVVRGVSSVEEHGDYLYLAFFDADRFWRLPLPASP